MKRGKKIIGLLLVIVFSFLYAHIDKNTEIYDRSVENSDYTASVMVGKIQQEFTCQEETLDGVRIKIQSAGEITDEILRLTLIECESGRIEATSEVLLREIKSGKFHTFSFETVENCKGKKYKAVLELESENRNPEGYVITFQQPEGTYIMKTVTSGFDTETFGVLLLLLLYIYGFMKFLYWLFSR